MLTAERLREVLSYDPETGVWTWRVMLSRRCPAGSRASSDSGQGYRDIRVDKKKYRSGRLAWLYMTGEWPKDEVDHENGVRNDDRWENLREATGSQNTSNRKAFRNTSGFKGVSWHKSNRKWRAEIQVRGVQKNLGYFDDPKAAHAVYCAAARREHGEFARTA